ncbi:LysR family transcriptional regulator [Maritalea porphyrae]|uniref:LysR family transcriptional regulator n=1 Tax=Maritalea porphyrae TaxID=880732 RepID=UPI0022AEE282|nr:LysR family transcriptional regulator [Maritalea porphyrae]MCZ4271087.1 LysR family transcriptional regulator [Maritalea porphyrae]
MNWQEVNFDWNQVRAFLATAEEGSFSGAARALSTTQPTITRQVAGLETSLNSLLFERSTRGLRMTLAGQQLFEHVREMGSAASRISMVAQTFNNEVSGEVSITAVDTLCVKFVAQAIRRLKHSAPGLTLRIISSVQIQDLKHRDADIAIRHVRPTQSSLVAKLVGNWTASFYAHQSYLDQIGLRPDSADHENVEIIGPSDPVQFIEICKGRGLNLRIDQFTLPCTSALVAHEMLRAGLGAGVTADVIAKAEPEFVRLWPHVPPIDFPVWLVTHQELHTSKKIRVVFDVLEQVLKEA